MKMSQLATKELLSQVRQRYTKAGRTYKTRLLDEFCKNTGYSRKHACKLLNGSLPKRKARPGRKKVYDDKVKHVLKEVWMASDQLCSKLLKPVLKDYLRSYERKHGELSQELKSKLGSISPATMDRLLSSEKVENSLWRKKRLYNPVREKTPVRCEQWDVQKAGWIEADTVAHCGGSMAGSFVWTLTCTDIRTGWTECRSVWNKGGFNVKERFKEIEATLPFALLGVDTDNGSEFLNYHLNDYLCKREVPVQVTRSRPYHKNDNAHVEQKNFTHVRRLLGYDRLEDPGLVELVNALYCEAWVDYKNFFAPTFRLKSKMQIGGKYIKHYENPQTPYQRLITDSAVSKKAKKELKKRYESLDPFSLKEDIERRLKDIFELDQQPIAGRKS
jgi:hypothetical protein